MIKETEKISVLNYNENRVSLVVAPDKSYSFDPSDDGITPCVIPMTMDEIRYANNSGAFKNGVLFFDSNRERDVYESLNIANWEGILKNDDIKDIIINPTYEKLTKLISIKDSAVFERVRAVYQKIRNDGTYDVSVRVEQIIKTRYKELLNRQINTSIILTKKDIPEKVSSDEVDALKEQNKAMQEQLEKMQKMMEQMMSNRESSSAAPSPESDTKKAPGRPKKVQ
ncbi:hypothetical protein [Hungatella hathewayi]|uniref:hypothetical protein n=1 Tax=Hungatella hathewayi TaxID=154046 RepID=UPI0035693046